MNKATFKRIRSEYRRLIRKNLHVTNGFAKQFCNRFERMCGVVPNRDLYACANTGDRYGSPWIWAFEKRTARGHRGEYVLNNNQRVCFGA